jgi:hypothetical protein
VDEFLPLDLRALGLRQLVSCDGQIYAGFAQCSREARIHCRLLADPARFPEATCACCGGKLDRSIRHLCHDVYCYRDGDNQFESDPPGLVVASGEACGSHALAFASYPLRI